MDVGFVGLGQMGQAMARNLCKAGHRVTVFNRTRERADALAADGAIVADSPAAACRGEAVFTMVSDDRALEAVAFGADGIVAGLKPEAIHISSSTISIALSQQLTEAHQKADQSFVAAPVFGRPEAAAAAKLFIIAAAPPAALERCQPLFDAIGQRCFRVGAQPRDANLVKLSGNFLLAAMLESLGEAFALIRKGGIDPQLYLELLTNTLFSAPVYKTYGTLIATEQYQPAGFTVALGLKDVQLALSAAGEHAVPLPVASLVRDHLLTAVAQGNQNSDWASVAAVCAENAGLQRR
jgi:3-hydroxyisobutyrate dehydrogenase-like beta-hydroxyacid dehydrogenase